METRRFWLKLLFFAGIIFSCWNMPAFADDPAPGGTPAPSGTPSSGSCEFTEEDKKNSAQPAADAVRDTAVYAKEYEDTLKEIWYASSGSCHFLKGTDSAKWWREATTQKMDYTKQAIAGATYIDNNNLAKIQDGTNVYTLMQGVNQFLNNREHTDWSIKKIISRIQQAVNNLQAMKSWMTTAKKCTFEEAQSKNPQCIFAVDECASEILEETYNYSADCTYAYVVSSNDDVEKVFACYQNGFSGTAFTATMKSFNDALSGSINQKASVACPNDLQQLESIRQKLVEAREKAHGLLGLFADNPQVTCECSTEVGDDGKPKDVKTCTAMDTDFIEDPAGSNCRTVAQYQAKMAGGHCIICKLFHTILLAVQNIAQKAFDNLAQPFKILLGIGFAVYIGYLTLLAVGTPSQQKISEYLKKLTTQGFQVALAIMLLSAPATIYDLVVSPLIDGGIDFGITLVGESRAKVEQFGATYKFNEETNSYLKPKVLQNAVGAAAAFNDAAVLVPAVGQSLICNAWEDGFLFEIFPNVKMWFIGAIFYIFGLLIAFAIGFYMLDCALQLGIVCAMIPLFIACWPFKVTRGYSKQGWNIFLNTFFNFVIMGVVISASSQIMLQALSSGLSQETLIAYLDANNAKGLSAELDLGGLQMVVLIISCLIAMKLSGEVQSITNKLAGGIGLNMGAQMGGAASSAIQKGAHNAVAAGWQGLKAGAGTAAEASGLKGAAQAAKGAIGKGLGNAAGALGAGSKAAMGGIANTAGKAAGAMGFNNAAQKLQSIGKGRDSGGDGGGGGFGSK